MDSIEKDLEAQLQDSGFEISNEAPEGFENVPQENVAPATALEGIEPDFDLSVSNETDTQTATATEPQATEQEAVEDLGLVVYLAAREEAVDEVGAPPLGEAVAEPAGELKDHRVRGQLVVAEP